MLTTQSPDVDLHINSPTTPGFEGTMFIIENDMCLLFCINLVTVVLKVPTILVR